MKKPSNEQGISIRGVTISDAQFMLQMENDPSVWQYSSANDAPYLIEQIEQFCIAMQNAAALPDSSGQLRMIIEQNNRSIGAVDLYQCDFGARCAKVAILIYPPQFRGHHYGRIALHQMIAYALTLGIEQLTAEVEPQNEQSRNLFIGCGFRHVSSTPEGVMLFSR